MNKNIKDSGYMQYQPTLVVIGRHFWHSFVFWHIHKHPKLFINHFPGRFPSFKYPDVKISNFFSHDNKALSKEINKII